MSESLEFISLQKGNNILEIDVIVAEGRIQRAVIDKYRVVEKNGELIK